MADNEHSWIEIAITGIRGDQSAFRQEVRERFENLDAKYEARFAKLERAQEDQAQKEFAARLLFKVTHRMVRLFWYVILGVGSVGGYLITNWTKIKEFGMGK